MIGKKFHRLLVIEKGKVVKKPKSTILYYICQCECGVIKEITGDSLRRGASKSCGCWNLEVRRKGIHGFCKSSIYDTLRGILARCYNPEHISYKNYGAKGVTVCDAWRGKDKYKRFYEYLQSSIGFKPSSEHTIDRVDGTKPYEPGNIRWATRSEQNLNQRHRGKTSKYRGVQKKGDKWLAFIWIEGKSKYLGQHPYELDAANIYARAYYAYHKKCPPEY